MRRKHWRSWLVAIAACAFGLGAYQYDNQIKDTEPHGSSWYNLLNDLELVIMGPGMGVLGFLVMENLQLKDEAHQRTLEEERRQRFHMLGRIAASIAHEIRNPLQNLRLINEELRNASPDSMPRWLDRLEINLGRLDQAVHLAYELARPSLSEDELDRVELSAVVAAAVEEVQRQLGRSPALELEQRSGVLVRGRGPSLRIAVENLVRNAFEATGSGLVTIRYQELEHYWVLELSNPGTASPALRTGTDTIVSTKPTGIGVGVSIARHLARSSNGDLTYANEHGCIIARLSLPKLTAAGTPAGSREADAPPPGQV